MPSAHPRPRPAIWLGMAAVLLTPRIASASEPRLDELAAARGIAAGELAHASRVAVPAGSRADARAERRSLALHGLPLRGAFETVWIASDGAERVVASRYPTADAELRPEQVRVDRDAARARFVERLSREQRARLELVAEGELVYLVRLGRPLLAWEFTAPLRLGPSPSRERIWISAATGRVLDVVELVDFDNQAEVFEINPQHTPTPTQVTLANVALDQQPWAEGVELDGTYLTGSRVRVFNCVDEDIGPQAPWHDEDECYPVQTITADGSGDFFVPLPDVTQIADNTDPTDAYAELSMYWHAEKLLEFMAQKGVDPFRCELSNMLANYHFFTPVERYPELDFGPYNNAFHTGVCTIEDGPTMVFGQGSSVDFGYDGDVVYHELGHGIVMQLTPEGLRGQPLRGEAVLQDSRAINEGIADYHTIMLTQRPELGDYAGYFWPDLGRAWVRDADSDAVCPRDMAGQQHNDSAPLTAALWATRQRVGVKLDDVVLGMLPLLASDATLEQAAAALMEVAAAERDAGAWTQTEVDWLERALASRNLFDCERVVDDPISDEEPRFLYLRNNGSYVSPFWPGPLQFRQVVPDGSDNLLLSFEVSEQGNSSGLPVAHDVEVALIIKRSSVSEDAAMAFEYELAALGHHDEDGGDVDETWEVIGDWDELYLPTELGEARRQILIRGLEPGEAVHMSFVNLDRRTSVVRELVFSSVPSEELDEGSPGEGREPEAPLDDEDEGGCACSSREGGAGGPASLLALVALLGLGRRRRRRPAPGRSSRAGT